MGDGYEPPTLSFMSAEFNICILDKGIFPIAPVYLGHLHEQKANKK